jgi:hypothetical protein
MRQWRWMGNVFIMWHSQKKCIVALPRVNAYLRCVFFIGNCIRRNIWETPFVMAMLTYHVITHNNVKNHLIWTYFHVSNLTLQNQTTNIILRFLNYFPIYSHTHTSTDALPSPGVNPLEGSPKCSYGKLGLGRRSRLPAL